jgi:hypothetical protein
MLLVFWLFLDLSEVKRALEAELQKCNSSCQESLRNYVANMSTNADFQQVSDWVKSLTGTELSVWSHCQRLHLPPSVPPLFCPPKFLPYLSCVTAFLTGCSHLFMVMMEYVLFDSVLCEHRSVLTTQDTPVALLLVPSTPCSGPTRVEAWIMQAHNTVWGTCVYVKNRNN